MYLLHHYSPYKLILVNQLLCGCKHVVAKRSKAYINLKLQKYEILLKVKQTNQ